MARELIENDGWSEEMSSIDENTKKKLENVSEGWSSISYCACQRAGVNGTGESLEGQNSLIKSANVRENEI